MVYLSVYGAVPNEHYPAGIAERTGDPTRPLVLLPDIVLPWTEQAFDAGNDPFPEDADGEEAAQHAADENLDDVTAGPGIQVAVGDRWQPDQQEAQQSQPGQRVATSVRHVRAIVARRPLVSTAPAATPHHTPH
jgi:hypothetical protein